MRVKSNTENNQAPDVTTIEDWLGQLGLERYAASFAKAEVEFTDLPDLTDEDLKEIGLAVGPRRKVSSAIKLLHTDPSAALTDRNSIRIYA